MVAVAEVRTVGAAAGALVRTLDVNLVALPDALPMWEAFDEIERHAATAKLLLMARVDESRAARRTGHRDTAEMLAKKGGTSTTTARRRLETAKKLSNLPTTEDASRNGDVSPDQADVIAGAAATPAAERSLLDTAQRSSFAELRDEALRARANDEDREATQRRIHEARKLRTWTDAEGAWNLTAHGTVVDGSKVKGALEPIIDDLFNQARTDGRRDQRETYAFDALVALAERASNGTIDTESKRTKPSYLALLRIDLEALLRGDVADGELCEITGLGPGPASTSRELLGDAILKLVITKGVDVLHVTHLGRGPSAAQRVAFLWTSPGCTVEGCPPRVSRSTTACPTQRPATPDSTSATRSARCTIARSTTTAGPWSTAPANAPSSRPTTRDTRRTDRSASEAGSAQQFVVLADVGRAARDAPG